MVNEADRRAAAAVPTSAQTREQREAVNSGQKSQAIRNAEHEAAKLERVYGKGKTS